MEITIAQRYRPFSHKPGCRFLVPGTTLCCTVYPVRIEVHDLSTHVPVSVKTVELSLKAPVKGFTVEQDLEKGEIHIWGTSQEGYIRWCIKPREGNQELALVLERGPKEGVFLPIQQEHLLPKQFLTLGILAQFQYPTQERLSLGCHKAQEWEKIRFHSLLTQFLPFWHRLGCMTPQLPVNAESSTFSFLQKVKQSDQQQVSAALEECFAVTFQKGFSPELVDADHLGYRQSFPEEGDHPLFFLSKGALLIRKLFLQFEENTLSLLPLLPPECHCGRLIHVQTPFGEVDLEWSKKRVRRFILRAERSGTFTLRSSKSLKSYRLRLGRKKMGERFSLEEAVSVEAGQTYYFDNFQK